MAVSVILTMASRGFNIFGSGTSLTSSFCFPYQQFAFINSLVLKCEIEETSGGRLCCGDFPPRTLAFRGGSFARFDHGLKAPQIHLRLDARFLSEQLCHC